MYLTRLHRAQPNAISFSTSSSPSKVVDFNNQDARPRCRVNEKHAREQLAVCEKHEASMKHLKTRNGAEHGLTREILSIYWVMANWVMVIYILGKSHFLFLLLLESPREFSSSQ
jgi:hypothetical protein